MTSPSRITIWLPVTLSITAGSVDVIAFLALGGLFTAHITGNLVIVATHYATGAFSRIGPILAVPVFIVVLGVVVFWFGQPDRPEYSRRALLSLHMALLTGCLICGLSFGPFDRSDSPTAVITGMLAVAAMATQNALVKLSLMNAPSTAVMTTNTTQLIIDLVALATRGISGRSMQNPPARHYDVRVHCRLCRRLHFGRNSSISFWRGCYGCPGGTGLIQFVAG